MNKAITIDQHIKLFWRALAGTGMQPIYHQGGRGMDKQLSHACLSNGGITS